MCGWEVECVDGKMGACVNRTFNKTIINIKLQ